MSRAESNRRYHEKRRDHPDERFLKSGDWQKIRRVQLSNFPICRHCELLGKTVRADQVDHVTVPNGDHALQRSLSNLQSLCAAHHAAKTRHQNKKGPVLVGYDHRTGHPIFAD
jgi:5-methylcytosine-specific restriction endonuclease McrA